MLLIHVQPDEGVSLAIGAKVPGAGMSIRTVHMDFLYGGAFCTSLPEAYERLILDAMLGDATLFTRADEVDEQWALVDAIVAAWKRDRPSFPNYPAGTWGPPSADELIHRDGRSWRPLMPGIVAQVEKRLSELRVRHAEGTRTSVLTPWRGRRRTGPPPPGGHSRASTSCIRRGRSCSSPTRGRRTRFASTSSSSASRSRAPSARFAPT